MNALRRALAGLALLLAGSVADAQGPAQTGDVLGGGLALSIPNVPAGFATEQRGPLAISYPQAQRALFAGAIARLADDAAAVATPLGLQELPRLSVRFANEAAGMRALAPPELPPPAYASGVAYASIGMAIVSARSPGDGSATAVAQVARHELAHLVWGVATGQAPSPRWFSEGLAVNQSGERSFDRFEALARASVEHRVVRWDELDARFNGGAEAVDLAYAESADIVAWLIRRDGAGRLAVLAERLRAGDTFVEALHVAYGRAAAGLEEEWRGAVHDRFALAPLWAGSGLAGVLLLGAVAIAGLRRWMRSQRTRARWAAEDRARRQPPRWLIFTPGARRE